MSDGSSPALLFAALRGHTDAMIWLLTEGGAHVKHSRIVEGVVFVSSGGDALSATSAVEVASVSTKSDETAARIAAGLVFVSMGGCAQGVRSAKECGGASMCEHGRERYLCKVCGGGGICEHGKHRSRCKECKAVPTLSKKRKRT